LQSSSGGVVWKGKIAFIRRWFDEVWNKKNLAAVDEMTSPNVIGHGQAEHGTDIGLVEFKSFARQLHAAFPDMRVTIDYVVEQDDKVVARWTTTMTHKSEFLGIAPTEKKVVFTGTTTQKISAGKIVEGWDNWDQLALLVQLGAVDARRFVPQAERAA